MTVEGLAAYRQLCLVAELRDLQVELHVTETYTMQNGVPVRPLDRITLRNPETKATVKCVRVMRDVGGAAAEILTDLLAA